MFFLESGSLWRFNYYSREKITIKRAFVIYNFYPTCYFCDHVFFCDSITRTKVKYDIRRNSWWQDPLITVWNGFHKFFGTGLELSHFGVVADGKEWTFGFRAGGEDGKTGIHFTDPGYSRIGYNTEILRS